MSDLEVKDFAGGITDEFLGADPRFSEKMDNLVLTPLGKPTQRPGISVYNSSAPQITPGNQRIDAQYYFDSTLFVKSGTKLYYLKDGDVAWTTLNGPNTDAFKDSELGAGASFWEWRGHLFITPSPGSTKKSGCRTVKVYRDTSSVWTLVQAGLPRAEDATRAGGSTSTSGGDDSPSYVYFFLFTREYSAKVDGVDVTFKDFGSPVDVQGDFDLPTTQSFRGYTYSNGADDNYSTSTTKVSVYRTMANGTEPLFVKEVALATVITDATADADLGDPLYTNGDTPYNDPPPKCYFSDVVESYGYFYAGVDVDSSQFYNTRVFQSQPNDPDSVPAGNYADVPGKLTARGHVGPYPVAFTDGRTYRIEGRYDAGGGGSMRAILVDDSEGCPYPDSVVNTEDGCFFASRNGWCWTDGFTVKNITEKHLRQTYSEVIKTRIRGVYDKKNKRVLYALEWADNTAVSGVNNALFVIEARHSKPDQACVLTWSSGADLQPNALCYKESTSEVLIGEQRGYALKFDEAVTTDYKVNTAVAASLWSKKGIVYDYRSAAIDFGSSTLSKWVTMLYLVVKNLTGNLSFDLFSRNDLKDEDKAMKVVRERTTTGAGVHRLKRFFPKAGLRSLYKQIRIKKGYVNLFRSDDYDLVETKGTPKTVQLASGTWPNDGTDDLRGHFIYFGSDSYTQGFEISVQSGDTLTVLDPGGLLSGVVPGREWQIKGYPKNEKFELHTLVFGYQGIGETYTAYAAGDDGTNE